MIGILYLLFLSLAPLVYATEQRNTISKPSFESPWYDVAAQVDRIQSIQHNLQDYPVKVDVQVKIRHNNTDYIFTASRSSQRDDDSNIPYGGAVYIYNQNEIIVTFPVRNNQNSAGGLAYTGSYGLYQGPANINLRGPYFKGKVKARAWLSSDLPTASINMSVYMNRNLNYKELNHNMSFNPDIMSVQIKLKECSKQIYDGYIAEAEGTVMDSTYQGDIWGLIFGYDDNKVRLWDSRGLFLLNSARFYKLEITPK
ncbi:uncharacterized protein LOC127730765 isoform X2 [Mytilus californianus]|uniref:uncharacterized protein LOC127730765 isoform X2 n=1 Tax=Mytilus californianus TaxID=6549 RepID=UPI002247335A|nr:uncharacterized protein LOC127730765 isoform X2 [Mytilus californianus]